MSRTLALPTLDDLAGCYRYCRDITHYHGANFSVGFRRLRKAKRDAVYAVYAFCRFADDMADENTGRRDPGRLLDSWQDALERCYRGSTDHPILVALADAASRFPIPLASFNRLIAGCRTDLTKTRYDTYDELLVYCDRVATTVSELSLAIFGWKDERTPEWGMHLSTALQLTNILRDVAEDARRGRIYLPQEDLERFGCAQTDLSAPAATPEFLHLMEFELNRVFRLFERARPLCSAVSADARVTVALMGGVYLAIARAIARDPRAVLAGRVQLTSHQKSRLVLRALMSDTGSRLGLSASPAW